MEQVENYGDERQMSWCVYCGGPTETRDHVPSKVLLDEPYPDNLPVVPACAQCNSSFSLDEEYLACLNECAVRGVIGGDSIERVKVMRILAEKPALAKMLEEAKVVIDGQTLFRIESNRVRNVVLKLARGHAAFGLNTPQFGEPAYIAVEPLCSLSHILVSAFETPPSMDVWPEAGSRAMMRCAKSSAPTWVTVQPGRSGTWLMLPQEYSSG